MERKMDQMRFRIILTRRIPNSEFPFAFDSYRTIPNSNLFFHPFPISV